MYLDRVDYDEMKRREAIVTAQFLDEAERMVEQGMLDKVSLFSCHFKSCDLFQCIIYQVHALVHTQRLTLVQFAGN